MDTTVAILREKPCLRSTEKKEIGEYHRCRNDSDKIESRTNRHPDCSRDPDIGRGREPLGGEPISHDRTSSEKPDTRNDLSRDTSWIIGGRMVDLWDNNRKEHEHTGTDRNEDMRAYPCWLLLKFSLDTEHECEYHSKCDPDDDFLL